MLESKEPYSDFSRLCILYAKATRWEAVAKNATQQGCMVTLVGEPFRSRNNCFLMQFPMAAGGMSCGSEPPRWTAVAAEAPCTALSLSLSLPLPAVFGNKNPDNCERPCKKIALLFAAGLGKM